MFGLMSTQRIFGEASEKNLYLSQLIILDTLEKCLAGVSPHYHRVRGVALTPAQVSLVDAAVTEL